MKIKNILCGIAFVLMAAACNDETFYVEAPKITTSTASIVLEGSDAGEAVFTFTANLPWHIEVSAATADASIGDIKVSPREGQGSLRPIDVTITYKANKDLKRDAIISILTQAASASVRFTQPGANDPTEVKGSRETPYKPTDAVKDVKGGSTPAGSVYVRGIVYKIVDLSPKLADGTGYGNATFWISDDGTAPDNDNDAFEVYRAKDYGMVAYSGVVKPKEGDVVTVFGPITQYKETVETKQNEAQILGVNGLGAPYGDGSADSPYNVGKAVAVASALADGVNSPEVYIKGIVSKVKSFSSNYGDFTYYITDDGAHVLDDAKYMQVYAGKSFGGEKFSSEEDLKVGDEVILRGTLANYKGNTPEVNKGSVLIQLNGKTE